MRPVYLYVVVTFPSAISSGIELHANDECIPASVETGFSLLQGVSYALDKFDSPGLTTVGSRTDGNIGAWTSKKLFVKRDVAGHSSTDVSAQRMSIKKPFASSRTRDADVEAREFQAAQPVKLSEYLSSSNAELQKMIDQKAQALPRAPETLHDLSSSSAQLHKLIDPKAQALPRAQTETLHATGDARNLHKMETQTSSEAQIKKQDMTAESRRSTPQFAKQSETYVQWFQWGAEFEVCILMLILAVGLAIASMYYAGAFEIISPTRSEDDILAEVYATARSPAPKVAMPGPSKRPGTTGLKGYIRVPIREQHFPQQLTGQRSPGALESQQQQPQQLLIRSMPSECSQQPLQNADFDGSSCQLNVEQYVEQTLNAALAKCSSHSLY